MSARSRFLEPPRLRTLAGGEQDDRRATWLELFFDLVFVAAVGQLASALSSQPTAVRFFEFLGLFVPVWWAWSGYTFYANRFDTDDLPYRLLTLLGMFGVAVLATTVPGVFKGVTIGFPLAYVGVRSVLLVLYERARRHVPEARSLARASRPFHEWVEALRGLTAKAVGFRGEQPLTAQLDVIARRYSSSGAALSDEFKVNTAQRPSARFITTSTDRRSLPPRRFVTPWRRSSCEPDEARGK